MNNIYKKYIKDYLKKSSEYSEKFYPLYKDRVNIKKVEGFEYYPHGIGILIKDLKNNLEIDFDYFNYKQDGIKYFDLWKLNNYIQSLGKKDILTDEIITKLEEEGFIKQYNNYYIII